MIEVDLVAGFQSDPDRASESFKAAAGINRRAGIPIRHAPQGTREALSRVLVASGEVDHAHLKSSEGTEALDVGVELRPKHCMQGTQARVHQGTGEPVAECAAEVPLEVVIHFG